MVYPLKRSNAFISKPCPIPTKEEKSQDKDDIRKDIADIRGLILELKELIQDLQEGMINE